MGAPAYRLRAASRDDYAFMMRVGHDGLRPHVEPLCGWDEADHERGFAEAFDVRTMQVVVCGEEAVGYLQLAHERDHVLLAGVYLHADWRGRGLGGALLATLCADADDHQHTLRLRVHHGNPARRLYERHGFVVSGETATAHRMTRAPR